MFKGLVVGLVEDDALQAELFSAMLEAGGMRPVVFSSVRQFRRRLGVESIDVLILDWNLPEVNGIELLRGLRAQAAPYLPVILLTANHHEKDIVYGLQCGADDYIVKPPRAGELIARIQAAHRRGHQGIADELAATEPFEIDLAEREIKLRGVQVRVTDKEFDLIIYLFRRSGKIVSRQMLLTDVWRLGSDSTTRTIDTFVSRIRKSLSLNGESGWTLEAVYQHGYRLVRSVRSGVQATAEC